MSQSGSQAIPAPASAAFLMACKSFKRSFALGLKIKARYFPFGVATFYLTKMRIGNGGVVV